MRSWTRGGGELSNSRSRAAKKRRKCTTSIEGLYLIPFPEDKFKGIDFKKIVRSMKRNFKCNGA